MRTDALDYDLPDDRIATTPAEPRDSARLMLVRRDTGTVEHRRVADLPGLGVVGPGDLMLVNQTRVLPAYLAGQRDATGGRVSGLYLGGDAQGRWQVMLESRGTLTAGETLTLGDAGQANGIATIELLEALGAGQWLAQLRGEDDTPSVLERVGRTPLPPYIRKQRRRLGLDEVSDADTRRYNTVYAGSAGSVAAPTAGLHFTDRLLTELGAMGVGRAAVDLHVGIGTFAPVRSDTLEAHAMHEEWFSVPKQTLDAIGNTRAAGGRLFVVGTTTVRALESLPTDALDPGAYPDGVNATTDLFIHPDAGFSFRYTDRLMTNFHLPRSTLLALVASLPGVGLDRLMDAYRQAVKERYRFYSYGDAMLVV
ncbi:MAG: tRNA preQ1(34) S-adenosylmethionine ribosyltransferase-isomerase QueA [Phycisphaeraceae bacterium]